MGKLEDIARLARHFPDAPREELWAHSKNCSLLAAINSLIDAGYDFHDITNEEDVGSPEAKKRRPGTAPKVSESTAPPPTPPGAGHDATAVAPPDGNILSPSLDSMSLLGAAPAPPALDAAMDAAKDVSDVAVEIKNPPVAGDVSEVAVEQAPAAEKKKKKKSELAVEQPPAAEKKKKPDALPDYAMGEITDPQPNDMLWDEGSGRGPDYHRYHAIVTAKKAQFDETVPSEHRVHCFQDSWLESEEAFMAFQKKEKYHKRALGLQIVQAAFAEHQGRFYIKRDGKRYEVSKTHPRVLAKGFATLCRTKMSHAELLQQEERQIKAYVRAVSRGEDPPIAIDQKHGNTVVVKNKNKSVAGCEREENSRNQGIVTPAAALAASWAESKKRFLKVIWDLAKKDRCEFIKFCKRKDILVIFERFLEDGDLTAADITDEDNKDNRFFGVIVTDVIALGAELKKDPGQALNSLKDYMKPAKCNPNVNKRPGGRHNSEDVFIFHSPDMFGSKKGKQAMYNAKIHSTKVFLE